MASAPPAKLMTLQAGRAIAALAVVALHASLTIEGVTGGMPEPVAAVAGLGWLGVDFFFVLSGFIIYHCHARSSGDAGWSKRYALGRFTRIYAPYLPVGIAVGISYTFLRDQVSHGGTYEWDWLSTLTLAPTGQPALSIAWTLQHEVVFYALAWALLRMRIFLVGSLVWAALIAVWTALFGFSFTPLVSPMNLEFLFGAAAAWCVMNEKAHNHLALAGIAALAFAAFALAGAEHRHSAIVGLGIACLLIPIVRSEKRGALKVGPPLPLIGAASYSVYLVHQPLISAVARPLDWAGAGWAISFLAMMSAGVAAGFAYHFWYERPVLRALRTRAPGSEAMVGAAESRSPSLARRN